MSGAPLTAPRFVGASVPRREDRRLLTGQGEYVDDVVLPGMLHAAFARSFVARGRIVALDVSAARALPGVIAVITGEDDLPVLPRWWPHVTSAQPDFRPLAVGDVRYVGDPLAMVVAESRYLAEDAVGLIEVDIEPLEPVLDYEAAALEGAPLVHHEMASNVCADVRSREDPELDAAFAAAEHVITETIRTHRVTQVPMETRGIVASWDRGTRRLTVYNAGQAPHVARAYIAKMLALPEHAVRVVQRDVGGGFGQKMYKGRDELCVLVAAMRLGRPVKWIEDREENLTAAQHAHDERVTVDVAVDGDGVLQAMRYSHAISAGAYTAMPPDQASVLAALQFPGPYRPGRYGYRTIQAYTNTCQLGPYRGPWSMETTAREMMMDIVARRLGIDPLELRRRNVIQPSDLPFRLPTGITYKNISPAETLEQAAEISGYAAFRERQAAAREEGRYLGIGLSSYVEPTAFGGGRSSGIEAATIRVQPDGTVTVLMGFGSHGQSVETTMAQVVADRLGVPLDKVVVEQGDTASAPVGRGNGGSRSAVVGGAVAGITAEKIRTKVLAIAGHLMEVAPEDLEMQDAVVAVKGSPTTSLTLAEIANVAYNEAMRLPEGMEPGLEDTARYSSPPMTHGNATHVCTCEVDVDTGLVTLLDYTVSEDCGVIINPNVVDGQITGGVVQGIGSVLLEESGYDDMGNPTATSFKDYLMPTADIVPTFHIAHVVTPSDTPGGHKGVGEGGMIGAIAATANAVADALAPLGVTITTQPLSPSRILELLDEARARA